MQLVPVDHDPFGGGQQERPYVRVGGDPMQQGQARPEVNPTQRAFLNAMAAGESPDYNTMYGGGRFEELRDHPRQAVPIRSGPNAGRTSSAAGRYQFLAPTWDEAQRELNLPDFSPESQDVAATWLAARDYKTRTGRDLWSDIEGAKGNPQSLDMIGGVLSKTWTSLPGGIEPNRATGGFGQRLASEFSSQSQQRPQAPQQPMQAQLVPVDHDPFAQEQPQAQPEMQGPPRAPVGMMESIVRGANQGVSANFGDEMAGLRAASGLPVDLGGGIPGALQAGVGAARMGVDYLTGGTGGSDEYTRAVEIEREKNKQAQEQNPGSYMGGNIAGAIALPGGPLLQAATLPARIGRGAAVGATFGGASGAGEGEDLGDRASRASWGVGLGGLVGGAAPVAMKALEPVGNAIAGAVRPITNALRGARDPDAEAGRRVITALRRDADAGDAGLTPAEFAAGRQAGTPVAIMDAGGETTRALARSSANTSPEARGALTRLTDSRFEGQGSRTVDYVRNLVSTPGDAVATRDALDNAARTYRKPFYDKAYADGSQGIFDDQLMRMTKSPVMESAMKEAAASIENKTASGRSMGAMSNNGAPTLEYWDQVQRSLRSMHEVAKRKGDVEQAADIKALRSTLVNKLDDMVPSFATARGVAAELFKATDALEAGEKFVTSGSVAEVRKAWSKMHSEERTAFAEGFVSALIEKINKTGDRRSILNSIQQSSDARQRLDIALGSDKAQELQSFLRVENIMDKMRGALGNSTTARQLMEAGLAGGAAGIYTGDLSSAGTAAGLWYALRAGGKIANQKIDQKVARRVGEMLASDDPAVLRKGLAIVSRSPAWTKTLKATDDYLAKIGGTQSEKGLAPMQSISAPRAESDDPGVNGPRP